ncbi:MAG: hypothetical protein FP825_07425 [Hyphomonas sp.]|uniref:hypothetical protein n=1 Tax=Hyphomonas sp. TaxID=87 RepID=UPI00182AEA9B|nr:hypothetical protein [Hyphomonas sp.]MBA3068292.1 hypothetical protein [Hyphomonas sp.]MBU3920388.1 hypothetical protein [Alphaproteobacteria bacterium]MBU4060842.1 hypothetical protein [Alphaproteobacteria bacterium]MBU4164826.1 hypothetical protein [Alphaproteobacteria bacterium]
MSGFLSIRNYVYFRHLFDAVHPFFWPVLYWQLKRAWLSLRRENLNAILIAITWWGGVRIVHRGHRIETPRASPFARTKPRYDNPVWFTDVPAEFLSDAPDFAQLSVNVFEIPLIPAQAGIPGGLRRARSPPAWG